MLGAHKGPQGFDRQRVGRGTENAHVIKGNAPAFSGKPKSGHGFDAIGSTVTQ